MIKSSNNGPLTVPTAPSAGTGVAQSASANTFGSYVQMTASIGQDTYIWGVAVNLVSGTNAVTYCAVQIGTGGAGSETTVGQVNIPLTRGAGATGVLVGSYVELPVPIPVANATRIAVKTASDIASALSWNVTLLCAKQADWVDAGVNESANVTNINGVTTSNVTTVNANQGTTQPVNFTGTLLNALVKTDLVDIAGSAVSTSTAQLGVNLVNVSGSAVSTSTAQLGVNVVNYNGNAVAASTSGIPNVNIVRINNGLTTGNNATLSLAGLSIVQPSAGAGDAVVITGAAADALTAGGAGINITGGKAGSSGGLGGGVAFKLTGGAGQGGVGGGGAAQGLTVNAGASSTNGTADAATITGNGTNSNSITLTPGSGGIGISGTLSTVTTATNLTNAPTAGDFTSTMKTSLNAATPASVTGAVGSVTAAVAITSNIKKNQVLNNFQFLMTDNVNHQPAAGKTVTVTRSIDNGAQAAGTLSAVTEIGNGLYSVNFAAADLNGNVIVLRATASGCDDTPERIVTQP